MIQDHGKLWLAGISALAAVTSPCYSNHAFSHTRQYSTGYSIRSQKKDQRRITNMCMGLLDTNVRTSGWLSTLLSLSLSVV